MVMTTAAGMAALALGSAALLGIGAGAGAEEGKCSGGEDNNDGLYSVVHGWWWLEAKPESDPGIFETPVDSADAYLGGEALGQCHMRIGAAILYH